MLILASITTAITSTINVRRLQKQATLTVMYMTVDVPLPDILDGNTLTVEEREERDALTVEEEREERGALTVEEEREERDSLTVEEEREEGEEKKDTERLLRLTSVL